MARVLLRLPQELHASLVKSAAAAGISFNALCVKRLAEPARPDDGSAARTSVVARATAEFGDRLLGIVALGSWVRNEAAAGSDIDVLVILDSAIPLTRDVYRTWDRSPLAVEGRVVDAHFAHLPAKGSASGAVWCEAAVDGVLWYDRDGRLSARLAEVRRAIADGRVARAFVHGQPYWKGAT